MPAESWGTGESRGIGRKYHYAVLVACAVEIVVALALGRPAGSIIGLVGAIGTTLAILSVRGKGVDPSKSTIQRVRDREFRKRGSPF